MKISTILDHIDSGHMALPEFQRGYVWNRDQVRGLLDSLYRRHPVGGSWCAPPESKSAAHRGDGALAVGVVKLLLDGQQRMTSLYGVVRGRAPKFFDGNAQAFTGLRFHLENETFEFYQPVKMKGDPLWTDVTELMQNGTAGLGEFVTRFTEQPPLAPKVGDYVGRLSRRMLRKSPAQTSRSTWWSTSTSRSWRHVAPAAWRQNGSRWTRYSGRWNGLGLPRSQEGVAGGGAQPAHGGSAARRHPVARECGGGRACAGRCSWRHHERRGRGTVGVAERVDCGRRLSPRCGGLRLSDPQSGEQKAVFDLVWPNGIQAELSQPVAVLLNEKRQTLALASQAGFRCFNRIDEFKRYVTVEILGEGAAA